MKKNLFFAAFAVFSFFGQSQELFRIEFDGYQPISNRNGIPGGQAKLPIQGSIIVLGGMNELDGMGHYFFDSYGSKLIVDSLDISFDGTRNIVFRREDGRDFFDLFPTVRAKLVPLTHPPGDSANTNIDENKKLIKN